MSFRENAGLRAFEFECLQRTGLIHAVFTRIGGESPAPWAALNFGRTVGDQERRVVRNQDRAFASVGRDPRSTFAVWQVHSADWLVADSPEPEGRTKADIVVTSNPQVTLLMRFADCLPILLYDSRRRAIGLIHAGWLGTVRRAAQAGVEALIRTFGSDPRDILAGIGPSIGPDHYPVGEDVIRQVRDTFGAHADDYLLPHNGEVRFDLWSANADLLRNAGVGSVEISGICTACHPEDWYSHRGEHGRTGRFGVVLALPS